MKKYLSLAILYYLRFFAKIQLAKTKPQIIGVTGSAGKSTCVAAIVAILKAKYQVKTTGTTNSESGIPLSILSLKMTDYSFFDWLRVIILAPIRYLLQSDHYDILVAEMGIDGLQTPKNMTYLLSIIQPKIGVFLNALPVHTLQMKTVDNIAREKGKLIASLPPDGIAIVNKNDPRTHIDTRAQVVYFSGDSVSAAKVVGKTLDISQSLIAKQLRRDFLRPPGRWTFFPGKNNSTLIDSSYNASPSTVADALQQLRSKTADRYIAVLGDMRELGALAKSEHTKIAQIAYRLADKIITVGPQTKQYFPSNKKLVKQFDNSFQSGKFLQTFLLPGDLVLFKGSQNTIFLETAVEMCLANKNDAHQLCRRGKYWNKQRKIYNL